MQETKKEAARPDDFRAYAKQVGGEHYTTAMGGASFQHWDYAAALGLGYLLGCATKYLIRVPEIRNRRHQIQNLEKARSYIAKYAHANAAGEFGGLSVADTVARLGGTRNLRHWQRIHSEFCGNLHRAKHRYAFLIEDITRVSAFDIRKVQEWSDKITEEIEAIDSQIRVRKPKDGAALDNDLD